MFDSLTDMSTSDVRKKTIKNQDKLFKTRNVYLESFRIS